MCTSHPIANLNKPAEERRLSGEGRRKALVDLEPGARPVQPQSVTVPPIFSEVYSHMTILHVLVVSAIQIVTLQS